MQLATKKATTFIQRKNLEKLIVGANPANDDDFFKEVWMLEPNVYKFHLWFYVVYSQPPYCKSISILVYKKMIAIMSPPSLIDTITLMTLQRSVMKRIG